MTTTLAVSSYYSSAATTILHPASISPLGAIYPSTSTVFTSTTPSISTTPAPSSPSALTTSVSSVTRPAASSSAPVVHTVYVGNGNHRFFPNTTYANPGDIVSFVFYPTNHSVVRGAYGFPCVPYEDTFPGKTGFFSGHFLTDGSESLPVWNLTINSTETLWYYCTALGSCTPNGMIGVINPPINASTALAYQEQQAVNAQYQLQPGEAVPIETAPSPSTSSTSAIPSAISTPATSPTSSTSPSPTPIVPSPPLSHGIIAGIAVGAVLGLLAIAAAIYYCGRNSVYRQWYKSEKKTQMSTESWLSGQAQYQAQQAQQAQLAGLPPRMEMADALPKRPIVAHESYVGSLASGGPVSPPLSSPGWWMPGDVSAAGPGGVHGHGQVEELGSGYEQRAQNYDDPVELEAWRMERQQQHQQQQEQQQQPPVQSSSLQHLSEEAGEGRFGGHANERGDSFGRSG